MQTLIFRYLGKLGCKGGAVVMRKVLSTILVSAAFCFEASLLQAQNLPSGQGPRPIAEPIPLGVLALVTKDFHHLGQWRTHNLMVNQKMHL